MRFADFAIDNVGLAREFVSRTNVAEAILADLEPIARGLSFSA
jgi:hypothetical protein